MLDRIRYTIQRNVQRLRRRNEETIVFFAQDLDDDITYVYGIDHDEDVTHGFVKPEERVLFFDLTSDDTEEIIPSNEQLSFLMYHHLVELDGIAKVETGEDFHIDFDDDIIVDVLRVMTE